MTKRLRSLIENVSVIIPVLIPNVVVWFIYIPKKISGLISALFVVPKNETAHTKSELQLKEILITSRIIYVSQDEELKMRKLFTQT